jgi:hypothetical protein
LETAQEIEEERMVIHLISTLPFWAMTT